MKFVKKHKYSLMITAIFLVLFVLAIVALKDLLYPDSDIDIYGDRLKDIEQYEISNENINTIKEEISKSSKVKEVKYNLEGRLMKFSVELTEDTDEITKKAFGDIILKTFDAEIKSYYDISLDVFVVIKEDNQDKIVAISGYKHKSRVGFVW